MKRRLIMIIPAILISISLTAAERKALTDVETDAFIADTQVMMEGAGDHHVAIAWWIPQEFWASALSRDVTTSEADKEEMLETMRGVSILAIVQADISRFGSFNFYSKEEIVEKMELTISSGVEEQRISPLEEINPDLEMLLDMFKPMLASALGNMGNSMYFYVLNDEAESGRLLDPYDEGRLEIELERKDGGPLHATIETPLNALYVPRKCPNGKDAHISWNYCPWSGKKLED